MMWGGGKPQTPYLPQTIYFLTPGNFNWTVLPYKNNVTVSVWGAGAAGSPSFGSVGASGVSSLFYGPSGTLTGFGGTAGGALNNQGQGGGASGGTDNETGGSGDSGAVLWTPSNEGSVDLWFDANNSGSLSRSGSNVNSWTDQASGVAVSAIATNPTYNSNLLNGLPGVVFASGGFAANTSHGSFSGPLSIYAVIKMTAAFSWAGVFGANIPPVATVTYDPSAVALFAAMTVQPSVGRKINLNNIIVSLKNAGVWQKLDVLYMMSVQTAQQASLNWINPGVDTLVDVGTPNFFPDNGVSGVQSSTTSYKSTNFSAINYTQNDACAFAWSSTNAFIDSDDLFINPTGAIVASINPRRASTNQIATALNSAGGIAYNIPPPDTLGLFTMSRTSSAGYTVYQNNVVLGVVSEVATGIPNTPMAIGPGARITSAAGFGASLTAQNVTDLYNAFVTYGNSTDTTPSTSADGEPVVAFISSSSPEFIGTYQAGINDSQSTQSLAVNKAAVVEWQCPAIVGGSWGPVTPYINGVQGGSIPSMSGFSFSQIGIILGTDSGTTFQFVGSMHEVIVATTSNNRQRIEGYLAWKWGLQSSLPSGHPYFSIPPTIAGGDGKGGASPHGGGQSSIRGNFPGGGGAGAGTSLGQGGGAGGFTSKSYTPGQLTIGANIAYTVGSAGSSTYPGANGQISIAIDQGFGLAPIFVGISYASNTGTVSLPVNIPAGTQNNDLMLMFLCDQHGVSSGPATGWNLVDGIQGGAYDSKLYYKIANNEASTFNWPSTTFPVIAIRTYRGANTATPINSDSILSISSLSCSIPALSEITAPNEVYVAFWTNNNQVNNLTAPGDLGNLSTNNSHLAWVSGDKIVSGTAGQETATLAGTTDFWNAIGVSIKP